MADLPLSLAAAMSGGVDFSTIGSNNTLTGTIIQIAHVSDKPIKHGFLLAGGVNGLGAVATAESTGGTLTQIFNWSTTSTPSGWGIPAYTGATMYWVENAPVGTNFYIKHASGNSGPLYGAVYRVD